jgi:hypothetical protein
MTNDKKLHHITPRYYLRGFTHPSSPGEICFFEKGKPPHCAPVDVVGAENFFYAFTDREGRRDSNTVENYLADVIEGPAKPVLDKVRARQPITASDKMIMSRYIAAMLTRVRRHRERLEELYPKVVEGLAAQLEREVDEAIAVTGPDNEARLRKRQDEIRVIMDVLRSGTPDWLKAFAVSHKYAPIINDMTWVLFTRTGSSGFVTSDNPVIFPEDIGLKNKTEARDLLELVFPISTNVALWATWRKHIEGYLGAGEQIVAEFNRRVVRSSTRFVYYGTTPRWVRSLVNKDRDKIILRRLVLGDSR